MNKKLFSKIIFLFLSCFQSGCFYVDTVAKYHLTGQIFDRNDMKPIDNSTVIFVELMEQESEAYASPIATSDLEGNVIIDFDWKWGSLKYLFPSTPELEFLILVIKENYIIESKYFRNSELIKTKEGFLLDLGKIYLREINKYIP